MIQRKDVTNQALMSSEQRYRRLFEAAQDGIMILDAVTGRIQEVNPFLCTLLGYDAAELLDRKLWEIGAIVDKQKSLDAFAELQENFYLRYDNMPLRTKDGVQIEVEFVCNVYDVSEIPVIQCNIRDISDRKRAERLQQAYDSAVLAGLSGIVDALTAVLEARDPYTAGHTRRVADL